MWPFKKKKTPVIVAEGFWDRWLQELPSGPRRPRTQLRIEYNCNSDMDHDHRTNAISIIVMWSKERNPEPTPKELLLALRDLSERFQKMAAKDTPKTVEKLMVTGELIWNATERIEE